MTTKDRKFQQKVTRRKEKVGRMILEQQVRLDLLDPKHEEYYRKRRSLQAKLSRLEQELRSLEASSLPGA